MACEEYFIGNQSHLEDKIESFVINLGIESSEEEDSDSNKSEESEDVETL